MAIPRFVKIPASWFWRSPFFRVLRYKFPTPFWEFSAHISKAKLSQAMAEDECVIITMGSFLVCTVYPAVYNTFLTYCNRQINKYMTSE